MKGGSHRRDPLDPFRRAPSDPFAGPWLTSEHAAQYFDFPTPRAFRLWATRHGVYPARFGRALRWAKADVLAAVGKCRKSA